MHTASQLTVDRSLARGIAWTSGVKWSASIITWGLTLFTARILTPADYGVLGMAMVWVGLAQVVSEVGLTATIIQAPTMSERLAGRLGGVALMVALAVASLTVGAAPLVAEFFREPSVRWVVTALGASFLLRGAQVLRRGLLNRALQFRRLAMIEGAEAIISASTALVAALMGARYWALVIGMLVGSGATTVFLVLSAPHPIHFPKQAAELEGTMRFGGHVLTGQLAWYAYSTADMIIVGRLLGTAALGAYTLAWVLASVALERIASLLGRVAPAIIAAVQSKPALLRRYVYAITEGLAIVTMPICLGVAVTADLIVPVVLGPSWLAAIAPMQLLALYAAVRCLAVVLPQVLIFTGRPGQSTRYNVLALVLLVPLFLMGASRMGTTGVAWVWVLAYPPIVALTYLRDLRREIGLTAKGYGGALWPAASASLVMVAAVAITRSLIPAGDPSLGSLLAAVAAGALAYVAVVTTFYRDRVLGVLALLRDPSPDKANQVISVPDDEDAPDTEDRGGSSDDDGGTLPSSRGRLLLICFHFPPDSVIGSLRWQKFAKIAVDRGWELDVVMRDEASIEMPDASRLRDLPPGIRRIEVPIRPLGHQRLEQQAAKLLRRFIPRAPAEESVKVDAVSTPASPRDLVRFYFALTSHLATRRWARDAAKAAIAAYDPTEHRAVIACGPPWSACIAGRLTVAITGLPLVLDFRDPWSLAQRLSESTASPVAIKLQDREEALAVRASSMLVVNSDPVVDAMRARYPSAHIIAVPNGYDDDVLPQGVAREKFIIAYAGTIYLDRDPRTLFEALAVVVKAHGLTPAQIGIEFMGAVERIDGTTLEERAAAAGVAEYVQVHEVRPRAEALGFLSGASLLALLPQDADLAIPGKLYEYMRFDAWLLVMAEPASATARLLEGSSANVVSDGNVEAIAAVIDDCYTRFAAGERGTPLSSDERFSRESRGRQFFGALDALLDAQEPPPRSAAPRRPAMQRAP